MLKTVAQLLAADFGYTPIVACEIEFTLHGADACPSLVQFWQQVRAACREQAIGIFNIEKERGKQQFEVALMPTDAKKAADNCIKLQTILSQQAESHAMRADFSAKPFADEPGNGLHVHVHLNDAHGQNIFTKDDHAMSAPLAHAIGGLLAWMADSMAIFAPHAESYARFAPGSNAPLTVSWGANNRTVAIRLPDSGHAKRIEHRVAGSDANPQEVIAVILAAMHWGLAHKSEPGPQIYGDASLEQYHLPRLPDSLAAAQERMKNSELMATYLQGGG